MKVQRKGEHEQYEVIEQSDAYYIVKSNYGRCTSALPKKDCEPVEEWVDHTVYGYAGIRVQVPMLVDQYDWKLELTPCRKYYKLMGKVKR